MTASGCSVLASARRSGFVVAIAAMRRPSTASMNGAWNDRPARPYPTMPTPITFDALPESAGEERAGDLAEPLGDAMGSPLVVPHPESPWCEVRVEHTDPDAHGAR